MARLFGYDVGGTLHIIVNNQVGFTTNPEDGRSTFYSSDLAKGYGIPVVHVNADDPEACLAAVRLAMAYRTRFRDDFVIDLVGYRRHGHNEGDEPSYTQPLLYKIIADHPTVRAVYADKLLAEGVVGDDDVKAMVDETAEVLRDAQDGVREHRPVGDDGAGPRLRAPGRTRDHRRGTRQARRRQRSARAAPRGILSPPQAVAPARASSQGLPTGARPGLGPRGGPGPGVPPHGGDPGSHERTGRSARAPSASATWSFTTWPTAGRPCPSRRWPTPDWRSTTHPSPRRRSSASSTGTRWAPTPTWCSGRPSSVTS